MKRTTRFITLVLTLILALSCSMQIFAEEVDPYAIPLCKHEHCMVLPNVTYEVFHDNVCFHEEYIGDQYTCISCNKVFYKNSEFVRSWTSHVYGKEINGIRYCIYCKAPEYQSTT